LDAEKSTTTFNNSILLLGRPGVGKTTAIREISRILSDEHARRVVIVDTSNEIAGDGDVPHRGIGGARRMQVPNATEQHLVLIEAVENHTPQTVVVDEIGTQQEADAARTISERGVQMIGTAHGHTLENVLKNPALCDLIGGVVNVTLGDDEARRRGVQKSVLERAGPPTFTIAVEMLDISTWRVHTDVAASVDALLAGQSPTTELRVLHEDGTVKTEAEYTSRRNASVLGEVLAYDATVRRPTVQRVQPRSSSELAALEIASAARQRSASTKDQSVGNARFELAGEDVFVNDVEDDDDDDDDDGNTCPSNALRVFPFKISRDALERVMESMDLGDRVCLVDLLEDASMVIAPKSQVKTSSWLRHAARARGMPIYAVRADNSAQLVRALQAMLGITGASDGFSGANGAQESRQRAMMSSADETDALEEVRMAVEQLVIPHRESVELLPRSARIIEMQQALVDTYMLNHSAVGEGTERRLRIEYEYRR
jgi:DNA polymerase III delta prime subunit